ncbi:MAG: hypothetical protein EHM87_23465, partial [Burkholderiales bacterium]
MSVAVEIEVTRSRAAARWAALAALVAASGAALAAIHLVGGPTLLTDAEPGLRALLACGFGLVAATGLAVAIRDLR